MGLPVIGGSDGAWGTTLSTFLGGAAADGTPTIPNNRIPYFASGNHTSSANLTFDGTTLTVPAAIKTASAALTITPAAGTNFNITLSTTGDFAVNTNQLYVDTSSGRVYIGATSVLNDETVRIKGPLSNSYGNLVLEASDGGNAGLSLIALTGTAANRNWLIAINYNTAGDLEFLVSAADGGAPGTSAMRILSNQTIRMPAYGSGTATFDANGLISSVSDERLKTIRGPFTAGLAELLKINPIRYNWNELSGLDQENIYTSFSAQNVMKWIPEAVGKNLNGFYSISDRVLIAALVNAVKSLHQEMVEIRAANGLAATSYKATEVLDETRMIISKKEKLIDRG